MLHDALTCQLTHDGMAEGDITSALDRLYDQATGTSATLWCLLEDVDHVADALPLSACLGAFVALKGAQARRLGGWSLVQPSALPSVADLAHLLAWAWRHEQQQGAERS